MSSGQFQFGKPGPTPWPKAAQYIEAVQNLRSSMSDAELRGGIAATNAMGLPMPYSGGVADVYQVHCQSTGNTWAVKFFKREVRGLRERYREISLCLEQSRLPFMVEFSYLEEGVRIGAAWYPIVKMRWIEGQTLNRFVAKAASKPVILDQLYNLWIKLATRLRSAGIAHADLQHGNVVLVPHDDGRLLLKLIDYDGMYVPSLAGKPSGELGHRNYQHPQREAEGLYNPEVDRFSHLAICCAVRCLQEGGRTLWERFDNGENLLFGDQDFVNPGQSPVFQELLKLQQSDARALVGHLVLATQRPLAETPLLEELLVEGHIKPLDPTQWRQVAALLESGRQVIGAPAPTAAATPAAPSVSPALPSGAGKSVVIGATGADASAAAAPASRAAEIVDYQTVSKPPVLMAPQVATVPPAAPIAPTKPQPNVAPPVAVPPRTDQPPVTPLVTPRKGGRLRAIDAWLARCAGGQNTPLHFVLRAIPAVGLVVLFFASLAAASYLFPRRHHPASEGLEISEAMQSMQAAAQRAYDAGSKARDTVDTELSPDALAEGERLLLEATEAFSKQDLPEAEGLFNRAAEAFDEALAAAPDTRTSSASPEEAFENVDVDSQSLESNKPELPSTSTTSIGPSTSSQLSFAAVRLGKEGEFLGQRIAWDGRLRRVARFRGETHVLVQPLKEPGKFEAFARSPEFLGKLADYQDADSLDKGDLVQVVGVLCDKSQLSYRLDSSAIAMEIESIRRTNDETSLAEVARMRAPGSFNSQKFASPLDELFRDIPDPSTTRRLTGRFGLFIESSQQVLVQTGDRRSPSLRISFPKATKTDFADYQYIRNAEVEVVLRLPVPPDNTFTPNAFKWEGVSIVRTGNRNSLITEFGRTKNAATFTAEKVAWGNRSKVGAGGAAKYVLYAVYDGETTVDGNIALSFRNLFDGLETVKLTRGGGESDESLKGFMPGAEVRLECMWYKDGDRSRSHVNWMERLDEGNRVTFPVFTPPSKPVIGKPGTTKPKAGPKGGTMPGGYF